MAENREPERRPVVTEVNLSAEVKKILGKKWNEPQPQYEFSNGRTFVIHPEELYD